MVASSGSQPQNNGGIDGTKLRLAVLGVLVVAAFTALFSRLWFLQVLASDQYRTLAKENSVRLVYSEPPRGRILTSDHMVLVDNRQSLTVTIDRQTLTKPRLKALVIRRLSRLLHVKAKDIKARLHDGTVSPYKPVPVVNDVGKRKAVYIQEHQEMFPGVAISQIPVRYYPHGGEAAQVLGYTGEISEEQLKEPYFKRARPPYQAGDIVGKSGIEREYDHYLRGKPRIDKVIVNATGDVISEKLKRLERPGKDIVLSINGRIQKLAQQALNQGIARARASGFAAPAGSVVIMDPRNGYIRAMASYPTYNPSMLADGITNKEWDLLGGSTPSDPDDDSMLNRPIQTAFSPGSTFKAITAGAGLWAGVISPYSYLNCGPSYTYYSVTFPNFESADVGPIGIPTSLEISCDTFYYQIGAMLENRFGASKGDGSEKFQQYIRRSGFADPTGLDLPYEQGGVVPDRSWCQEMNKVNPLLCQYGWLPGYTVNMSIGQGDLIVTPLQMAVAYSAIANGGKVYAPRVAEAVAKPGKDRKEEIIRRIRPHVVSHLGLASEDLSVIRQGLEQVVQGSRGTAYGAFAGFPLDKFPVAGKTGTAQIGETDLNNAWFMSYAPADHPKYVCTVLVQQAGFGGESSAPIARQ
ncbi:MAG TPA: penicillin-binding protein 2, partial [Actinomycetota bacterium]|nr:penicillin-binding protein 2 [Actinomycetota bacterium]